MSFRPYIAVLILLLRPAMLRPTAGADFLLLDLDARSLAQAGALGAGSQGLSQLRHNPSTLGLLPRFEAALTHVESFGEWSHDWAALAFPTGSGNLGLEFQWSRLKPFPLYDDLGIEVGSLKVESRMLGGAWAMRTPGRRLGAGASLKFFQTQLAEFSNWGYAFDFGGDFRSENGLLGAGLALLHAGEQSAFYRSADSLPMALQASLALEGAPHEQLALRAAADYCHYFDAYRPAELRVGAQATWFQILLLRGGFTASGGRTRPSLGGGFDMKFGELSYAFLPDENLGATHAISLEWHSLPSLD